MKKLFLVPIFTLVLGLTSCDVLNQLVPDVDQVVSETFTVRIETDYPSGVSDTIFVDITQYAEYQNYQQYITGYKLNKITYEVLDFSAPEDLYLAGSVIVFDTIGGISALIGGIPSINLSEASLLEDESLMNQDEDATDQLIEWFDDPGTFNFKFQYKFEQFDGSDYAFKTEDIGSSFKVKVKFYLTFLTGL